MKKLDDKQLYNIWKKYVSGKYFYRAFSSEYEKDILKNGLNPEKDIFFDNKKNLRKFLSLLLSFDKRGYKIIYKWHNETPHVTKLVRVLRKDLSRKYIDLNPDKIHNSYYLKRKGGSLITTISELIKFIEEKNYPLSKKQKKLISSLKEYCDKKSRFRMKTILIKKDSDYLEKARFQHFGGKYWPSPFGSFENFKKVMEKEDAEKYLPHFINNKPYYLRLTKKIPAKEIKIVG